MTASPRTSPQSPKPLLQVSTMLPRSQRAKPTLKAGVRWEGLLYTSPSRWPDSHPSESLAQRAHVTSAEGTVFIQLVETLLAQLALNVNLEFTH